MAVGSAADRQTGGPKTDHGRTKPDQQTEPAADQRRHQRRDQRQTSSTLGQILASPCHAGPVTSPECRSRGDTAARLAGRLASSLFLVELSRGDVTA